MSDTWSWQFNPLLRPVQTYDAPGEHRFFAPMRTQPTPATPPPRENYVWDGSDGNGWQPNTVPTPTVSTGSFSRDIEALRNNPGLLNAVLALASGPLGILNVAAGTAASAASGVPGVNTLGGYLLDRARELGLTPEQVAALREAQVGQAQTQVQLSNDRQTTREELPPLTNTTNIGATTGTGTTLTTGATTGETNLNTGLLSNTTNTSATTGTNGTTLTTGGTGTATTGGTDNTGLLGGDTTVTTGTTGTTGANTAQDYINSLYQDLFGRTADTSGLSYWSNLYGERSPEQLRQDIISGAQGADVNAYLSKYGGGLLGDGAGQSPSTSTTSTAATSTAPSMSQADIDAMNAESDALEAEAAQNMATVAALEAQIADVQSQITDTQAQTASLSSDKAASLSETQAAADAKAAEAQAALDAAVAAMESALADPSNPATSKSEAEAAAANAAAAAAEAAAAAAEADAAAADSDASDAGDNGGDGGDGDGGGGGGDGDGGYRKGGLVKGKKKNAAVKTTVHVGEYVVRPEAVNKYGLGLLNAINEQRIPKRRFTGLLGD